MNDSRLTLVVLAPLFGAVLSYIFGTVSQRVAGVIASAAVIVSFVCVVSLWSDLPTATSFVSTLSSWLSFGGFSFPLELYFDKLSAVMCLVVTGIGALIHIYSIGYMAEDESRPRFFSYLNLFIAAMLVLVLGKSLPTIFIGWEGVGLCSYLLIGFWYANPDFAKAGRKAFVMNRIGDVGFLVAMAVLYHSCGTLDILALKNPQLLARIPAELGFVAGIALFVAATGKSAQLPLFTWLPDAMAGPTPVSALIHAATMVTAGVYLMARMAGVVELDAAVPAIILWTALATSLIAAIIAMSQNDIKKVLAYSTVSQLGFMFIAIGVGAYGYALFHVVTHAFFKACLFLSAGSVIYGCHHEQDMRHMGGLSKSMPLTCFAYGVSTVAIAGIPPFSGYFSKHGILDSIPLLHNVYLQPWVSTIGLIATGITVLTAFYMFRSFILTFMGSYRGHAHPHEAPMVMTAPVIILAVLAVVGGAFLSPVFLSYLVGPLPKMAQHATSHGGVVGYVLGSLPAVLGIGLAFWLFLGSSGAKEFLRKVFLPLEKLSEGKFFVDEVYDVSVVAPLQKVSNLSFKTLDQTFFVGGGETIGKISRAVGELTARMTTGQVGTYILLMFCAAAFFVYVFLPVR
jgi:NADH-quinone oxidoreductase subunit L